MDLKYIFIPLNSLWIIKRICSIYKHRLLVIKYVKVYFKFKTKQFKTFKKNTNKIYINIPDGKLARYIYLLVHYLRYDFTVYFNPTFKLLTNLNDYSDWIINESGVYLKKTKLKPDEGIIKLKNKAIFFKLNYDYFTAVKKQKTKDFIFPYFMHVGQYKWDYVKNIDKFRRGSRSLSTLFVGGVNREHYNNPRIKSIFNCLTRYEVITTLEQYSDTCFPESLEDLEGLIRRGSAKLIIYITGKEKVLWQKDWLKTFAKANFFLALPGTTMPLCHNLIEALCAGTIPILQYNQFIYPFLEHGKNCLVFSDIDHLRLLLDEIKHFSKVKIDGMRKNVIDYYDSYFSTNAFSQNFKNSLSKINNKETMTIYFNSENISSTLYGNMQKNPNE
jgi:hypothetical protein